MNNPPTTDELEELARLQNEPEDTMSRRGCTNSHAAPAAARLRQEPVHLLVEAQAPQVLFECRKPRARHDRFIHANQPERKDGFLLSRPHLVGGANGSLDKL